MILEGVVTTLSASGEVHVAPMGPRVDSPPTPGALRRFVLRPFRSAQTYANLKAHGEGVLHVTDDVLLLARSAVGLLEQPPPVVPARVVRGWVLADACRWFEFRVASCEESGERPAFAAEVVDSGRGRDFFGFNRAKHAVVEAAILATRVGLLPPGEVQAEFRRLSSPVEKTGGPQEREAFALLTRYVSERTKGQG